MQALHELILFNQLAIRARQFACALLHALFQRRDQAQVLDANRGLLRQTDQTMHFGLIECSALGKVRVDISNPLPADDQWNENGALRAELFGKQRACKLVEAWVFEYILNERG